MTGELFFTFHDVSINTYRYPMISTPVGTFTFHDVSINTANCCLYACREICFTFHDVSINTASLLIIEGSKHALHSTMFLLILDGNIIHDLNITFTFHDVSINTKIAQMPVNTVFSLHSTMFLLIPLPTPLFAFRIQLYIPRCFY